MTRKLIASVLVLPFFLTACGDGDDEESDSSAEESETLPADQAAVRDALVASFFDPSCDLVTEEYLLEKALLSDTPEEACDEHMQSWVEPQYDEDDVLVSDITITGDVATAVVGSDVTNITTVYELMLVDGTWKVSCDDFTCDHLEQPSAEVS
ncbi:hypothetical protein [Nocardioides bizhenqiangii]|uniref:DUF4878 domain-containing protein n=1 Tax=Nocardioides bizhenqiangii TaxID=3095076 RepID=A0ABZ0ZL07_9ACTN|nr:MULTISPECIES: hypothetical protein [unclassified Nocardioides]MDZ5620116.1 hypothetical protein [Nocardioides sp. HM23]MDZ5623475.1 hypothetical protein [Nocardioides sp. HM23]WQQ24494.1 hypothetical protein SHK19_10960 [Nocardioides sp. HM61]